MIRTPLQTEIAVAKARKRTRGYTLNRARTKLTALTSLHLPAYGSGGIPPRPHLCCVNCVGTGGMPYQCGNRRGHGPEGAYCVKHDPTQGEKE